MLLKFSARCLGIKADDLSTKIKYPFNHFYKNIIRSNYEYEIEEHSESELPSKYNLSKYWLDEGVDLLTQEYYGVRLDLPSNRIVIPEYDINGRLVGAKARVNDKNCPHDQRWSMYIPYPKSQICYGYHHNYKNIQQKDTVIIVESEKSVMQARSFGVNCCMAIGGHNISEAQKKIIKSLMVKNVIIAYDEGICQEESEYEAKKLLTSFLIVTYFMLVIKIIVT